MPRRLKDWRNYFLRECDMTEKTYECKKCGKRTTTSGDVPVCCGEPMKQLPLDVCLQPAQAEHARPMDIQEPCDDGRAG